MGEQLKNGVLVALGVAIWAALKGVAKIVKVIITVLTNIIIFFGLYIPLFYALFGVLLLAFTDFTLGGTGTNQVLYYVGLGLSLLGSVIITVRTCFVRPISAIFEPLVNLIRDYREKRAARRAEKEGYADDAYEPDPYDRDEYLDRYRDGDRFVREPSGYAPRYREYPPYEDRYGDRAEYPSRDPYLSRDRCAPRDQYAPREQYAPRDQYTPRDRYAPRDPYATAASSAPYAPRDMCEGAPRNEMPQRDYDRQDDAGSTYEDDAPAYGESYRVTARAPYEQMGERSRRDYGDPRAPYGDDSYPRFGMRTPREPEAERPLIYYSERRPGILVKEYSDRFDLYREDANGRVFIGTEYKGE